MHLLRRPFDEQYSCVDCTDYDDTRIGIKAHLGGFLTPTFRVPSSPGSDDVGTHSLFRDIVEQTGIDTPGSTQCDERRHSCMQRLT